MTAKFNLLVATAIPALAIVPLIACGGDSKKTPDAAGSGTIDAPGSGSGSGSGSNVTCALPANVTAFVGQSVRYRSGSGSGSNLPRANRLSFNGYLDAGSAQRISFTIYGGCGSSGSNCAGGIPNTPDWPTVFGPKSGVDIGPQGLDASAVALVSSGSGIAAIYLPESGTLDVTQAGNGSGAPFAGSVSNVQFVHVDIGSASVTPDPDGCTTNVSVTFSGNAAFTGKTFVVESIDFDDGDGVSYLRHRYTNP